MKAITKMWRALETLERRSDANIQVSSGKRFPAKKMREDMLECYVQKYMENDDREAQRCKTQFKKKYEFWDYY